MDKLESSLIEKLKTLNETVWEGKVPNPSIKIWLENFTKKDEQIIALFLLRQVIYFGKREIEELLKSLFRDLYKYPIIEQIRRNNSDTTDLTIINSEFAIELEKTRFVALGNISESSAHLSYNLRVINHLPPRLFIGSDQIFKGKKNRKDKDQLLEKLAKISRYVFFDDLCGSGTQAAMYSKNIVNKIKQINPDIQVFYYCLLATSQGLKYIRQKLNYDRVESIFELDSTFKCFSNTSRYFLDGRIQKDLARQMCENYGSMIEPTQPLGHDDSQLLLAFAHNTPDNCLPIFWSMQNGWEPVFKRFDKNYD